MMTILAESALASDVRLAVATEQLTLATRMVAAVGFAALVAAVVAAVAAIKTFLLEARPALVIAPHPMGPEGGLPHATAYMVVREYDDTGQHPDPTAPPTLRVMMRGDEVDIMKRPREYLEVHNAGRSAVTEANIHFTITIPADLTMDGAADIAVSNTVGKGVVRIAAIGAAAAVVLPVNSLPQGCKLEVTEVSVAIPALGTQMRRRQQLPYVAAPILIRPRF